MQRKKVFLPILDNGMGLSRTSWACSMINAALTTLRAFDVTIFSASYPYPSGAMNLAADAFLAKEYDEMLVIDTDVVYESVHLENLFSHDVDLVFGLYPVKQPGLNFPVVPLDGDNPFANDDRPLLREVKRCAKGFMRAKRKVFEDLMLVTPIVKNDHSGLGMYEFFKLLPGGHSEDFAFCDAYRAIGGKVMLDIGICCQHEGSARYPIEGTFSIK